MALPFYFGFLIFSTYYKYDAKYKYFVHIQIVEVDLALYHMYMLADWGHLPLIVSDGEQFASSMLCLIT